MLWKAINKRHEYKFVLQIVNPWFYKVDRYESDIFFWRPTWIDQLALNFKIAESFDIVREYSQTSCRIIISDRSSKYFEITCVRTRFLSIRINHLWEDEKFEFTRIGKHLNLWKGAYKIWWEQIFPFWYNYIHNKTISLIK